MSIALNYERIGFITDVAGLLQCKGGPGEVVLRAWKESGLGSQWAGDGLRMPWAETQRITFRKRSDDAASFVPSLAEYGPGTIQFLPKPWSFSLPESGIDPKVVSAWLKALVGRISTWKTGGNDGKG